MKSAPDFCWVAGDGALRSGGEEELAECFLAGHLPPDHPVWNEAWPEWVPLSEALERGWLAPDSFGARPETPAPVTERKPMRFDDPSSPAVSKPEMSSSRTLVDVGLKIRMEASLAEEEEVTVPRGPTLVPVTMRSHGPPPLLIPPVLTFG